MDIDNVDARKYVPMCPVITDQDKVKTKNLAVDVANKVLRLIWEQRGTATSLKVTERVIRPTHISSLTETTLQDLEKFLDLKKIRMSFTPQGWILERELEFRWDKDNRFLSPEVEPTLPSKDLLKITQNHRQPLYEESMKEAFAKVGGNGLSYESKEKVKNLVECILCAAQEVSGIYIPTNILGKTDRWTSSSKWHIAYQIKSLKAKPGIKQAEEALIVPNTSFTVYLKHDLENRQRWALQRLLMIEGISLKCITPHPPLHDEKMNPIVGETGCKKKCKLEISWLKNNPSLTPPPSPTFDFRSRWNHEKRADRARIHQPMDPIELKFQGGERLYVNRENLTSRSVHLANCIGNERGFTFEEPLTDEIKDWVCFISSPILELPSATAWGDVAKLLDLTEFAIKYRIDSLITFCARLLWISEFNYATSETLLRSLKVACEIDNLGLTDTEGQPVSLEKRVEYMLWHSQTTRPGLLEHAIEKIRNTEDLLWLFCKLSDWEESALAKFTLEHLSKLIQNPISIAELD